MVEEMKNSHIHNMTKRLYATNLIGYLLKVYLVFVDYTKRRGALNTFKKTIESLLEWLKEILLDHYNGLLLERNEKLKKHYIYTKRYLFKKFLHPIHY